MSDSETPNTEPDAAPADTPAEGGPGPSDAGSAAPVKKGTVVLALMIALAVLAAAVGIAFALGIFKGSDDDLAATMPDDTLVYATVYLDPSGSQKQNLTTLLSKFPGLKAQGITDLSGEGILGIAPDEIASQIEPWLGSQASVGVRVNALTGAEVAYVVDSIDDAKAKDAIRAFQSSPAASGMTWTSLEREGVEIAAATETGGTEPTLFLTVEDGTVIISPNQSFVFSILDTIGGDDSLAADANFTDTISTLPTDRLALAYVNMESAVQLATAGLGGLGSSGGADPMASLKAFRGLALTLGAESNGIAIDMTQLMDPSKVPAAQKSIADSIPEPHQNAVLAFTPENAYGVFALSGLKQAVQAVVGQLEAAGMPTTSIPGLDSALDALGSDAGIVVTPGSVDTPDEPAGALLLAVDDPEAASAFLAGVEPDLVPDPSMATPFPIPGDKKQPKPEPQTWEETDYNGVTIRHLTEDTSGFGDEPAWAYAVSDDTVIFATDLAEVQRILDAKTSGTNVTSSSVYQEAIAHGSAENDAIVFVNMSQIIEGIEANSQGDTEWTSEVKPNLDPIKAFLYTGTGTDERTDADMFLLID